MRLGQNTKLIEGERGHNEQMTKFILRVASLCLASPVILACCGRAVCDEKALPPAESAGGGIMPAPGK
jgi:hypothetical protein